MHKPLGSFAQFILESEQTTFSFGCVMACMEMPELIKNIHESIDEDDLDHEQGGLEDNTHCTILYGLHDGVTEDQVRDCVEAISMVRISNLSIFEGKGYDVLKFDASGPGLVESNTKLRDEVPYTNKFTDYHPHVTVAFLKKGTGAKYMKMWTRQAATTIPVTKVIYTTSGARKSRRTFNIA